MKYIITLLLSIVFLNASLLDFRDISRAKSSYESKDYKSAISEYKKVLGKDGAAYDLANSYYKAKKYKKALEMYKKVSEPSLKFKKLHNMGNTYANLGKIDDAIKSYEEALKIKQDKDTKYNLELLKKHKKKQKKKKKNKKNDKKKKDKKKGKKDSKKNQDKKDKNGKNKKNKKAGKNNKNPNKDKKTKGSRQKQNQNKQKKDQANKNKEKQAKNKKKVQPISDMEERKYKKILNKRGINTLMLPLSTKGEKQNEQNPW
jgi:Ca-activated chloride channel family protein